MKLRGWCAVALLLCAAPAAYADTANWEPAIRAFETRDAQDPPAEHGILFVGSSSIRFWNTDKAFPNHAILNRGFGGSQTSDVLRYMDRIVLPYKPRLIVLYVGDNDIAAGKTPERVVRDTATFFERVHEALPDTRIVYIAIKPSLARWELVEDMRQVNARVRDMAENTPHIEFVDVYAPMLGPDGTPREELFIADGLHLSAEGYALWNELVRTYLGEPVGD